MDTHAVQLDILLMVSWILLIPVGLLLAVVLYKLVFILSSLYEFMTLARFELYPTMKDLRQVASRLDVLSEKAVTGVETVEKGLVAAGQGIDRVRNASDGVFGALGGAVGSLVRSMWQSAWSGKKN